MPGEERIIKLVTMLAERGRIDTAAVASELGASGMTVRRDLDRLVASGVAYRVRGGAVSARARGEELPFAVRELEATGAKRRIAATAGELIRDGEAVILDSGTTALEVARVLVGRRATVMPLSLHAAMALASGPSIRLLMPAGEVRPGELALVGAQAAASVSAMRFDTAILTCCGLSTRGTMSSNYSEVHVKRAIAASADRVVLVADSTKFMRSGMALVGDDTRIDVVITDAGAPAEAVRAMTERGLEVVIA